MGSALVRVVLGVLVLATVAAFFVTQQLKSEFPLVLRFAAQPGALSPNGDGFKDRTRIGFDLSEPATVSFSILDANGNEIRTLVDERRLAGDTKHRFSWNGRDDDGHIVPDGNYRMRVVRRDEGRVIDSYKKLRVDTISPRPRLVSATPSVIAPGEPGQRPRVRIRYAGPRNDAPEIRVFRTDEGASRVVERFRGDDRRGATWNGTVRGRPAADGDYAFTFSVRDSAGNLAVTPAEIPSPRTARPRTGVTVRSFDLKGPLGVVTAGSAARLTAGPFDRSLEFALSRLGSTRALRQGQRIGGAFRVHVPEDAETGVYLVRVRVRGHRAVWPLAVAGLPRSRRAARRPRPLVVLPAITWQGENPVDSDHDGFLDTLDRSRSATLDQPFAGGRTPHAFNTEVAPLLDFLDRARLPYDLTTDVSLARGEGPALANAPGVAVAGAARWLPGALLGRLRSYVEGGGTVASFGADSFRRTVRLRGNELLDPSRPRRANAFGERTVLARSVGGGAPMQVFDDGLGLFAGLDSFFGDFTRFEESLGLPSGGKAREQAGREEQRPALVAYTLGKGLVLRAGTPQWTRELRKSRLGIEVPRATERIWALLAGNG